MTLAEAWNGTTWRIQPTATPPGVTFSQLFAVSCAVAGACTAVGDDTTGTLAEAWNGTTWKIQATPNPGSASRIMLSAVSCRSAAACTAVGSYNNYSTPLAEGWNGASWTIEAAPLPGRDLPGDLTGVSCTAPAACTAVGYRGSPPGEVPLVDTWDGTSWTIQAAARPARSRGSDLAGVSCPAAAACTATGSYSNWSDDLTLAETGP